MGFGVPRLLVSNQLVTAPVEGSVLSSTLQSLGYVSFLFMAEFFFGAAARSTSVKASFSPAAAAATPGANPFAVVQANRIHQNQMESFMILLPSALAAAASAGSADNETAVWIKACILSWVAFRFLYRLGYCYQDNPFWRITGVAASQTQSILLLWLWYQQGGCKV